MKVYVLKRVCDGRALHNSVCTLLINKNLVLYWKHCTIHIVFEVLHVVDMLVFFTAQDLHLSLFGWATTTALMDSCASLRAKLVLLIASLAVSTPKIFQCLAVCILLHLYLPYPEWLGWNLGEFIEFAFCLTNCVSLLLWLHYNLGISQWDYHIYSSKRCPPINTALQ